MKRAESREVASHVGPSLETSISFRKVVWTGILIVGITFGGFGTWMATAPLASAVVAEGVLAVSSHRKMVQHPQGGTVKEIVVRDGDMVRKGDPLIRLDDVRARTTLEGLRNAYHAARARKARLEAEKQNLEAVPAPPDLLALRSSDRAIGRLLASEEDIFATRRETRRGEISILTQKIAQLEKQIVGEQALYDSKKQQVKLLREELAGLAPLAKKGLVEKPRLTKLEREIARLEGEAASHFAESARLETQISELRLEVLQKRRDFRESVVAELGEVDNLLAELQTKLEDAEHTSQNTVIVAPSDGIVMGLEVHAAGEVINPGETILELVPENEPLVVEVQVVPGDVEDLRLGQKAQVRLTAFRQRITPHVEGELAYISADRFTDERTLRSYYSARISVSPDSLRVLGGRELQPGMPAEVVIESGERTALAYLVQPILDGLARGWREK